MDCGNGEHGTLLPGGIIGTRNAWGHREDETSIRSMGCEIFKLEIVSSLGSMHFYCISAVTEFHTTIG